jgi:hypothetical protein
MRLGGLETNDTGGRRAGWRGWMGPRALFLGKRPEDSQKQRLKSGLVRSNLRHRIRGRLDCCRLVTLSPRPGLELGLPWGFQGSVIASRSET